MVNNEVAISARINNNIEKVDSLIDAPFSLLSNGLDSLVFSAQLIEIKPKVENIVALSHCFYYLFGQLNRWEDGHF